MAGKKGPCDTVTGPFLILLFCEEHTGAASSSRLFPYVEASLEAQPPSRIRLRPGALACVTWGGGTCWQTPSPAAQVLKGVKGQKQTKSCTHEGTANKPLHSNGACTLPMHGEDITCVICGQVF